MAVSRGSMRSTRRATYVGSAAATIVLGLLVHLAGGGLPPSVRDIVGDALWAAMMLWWVSVVIPGASGRLRIVIAYGVCVVVEASQLLHPPWLDALRATTLGHLVLGSDFDARDLVAYAGGVALAAALDAVLLAGRTTEGSRRRAP